MHSQSAGTIIEVLSAHVNVLQQCDYYVLPRKLPLFALAAALRLRKLRECGAALVAVVTAKSPILGTGKNARFMLEIASDPQVPPQVRSTATFIVFVGSTAMPWWPFLHIGNRLAFVALKLAALPMFANQPVLKVSDNNQRIFFVSSTSPKVPHLSMKMNTPMYQSCSASSGICPPRKRMRYCNQATNSQTTPSIACSAFRGPFRCNRRTVTYEGVITECLGDGRLRLDDASYLHLGGEYSWCTGGFKAFACFRVGARIEAMHVKIAFQRGVATTMFPTAKTIINILYFGNLPEDGVVSTCTWHHSPWVRIWSYLPSSLILWVQELYDKLVQKFSIWFRPTQSMSETNASAEHVLAADRILGSKHTPGLIEHLLERLMRNANLFKCKQPPTHFYANFLGIAQQETENCLVEANCSFQYAVTVAELSAAVDVKWLSSRSAGIVGSSAPSSNRRVVSEVFSPSDLSGVLLSSIPNSKRADDVGAKRIVLIGILEGGDSPFATARLSDGTGAVFVEFLGNLEPALLGAVVIVEEFQVVVESIPGVAERNTTFVFNPTEIRVLVDGPYVLYNSENSQVAESQIEVCKTAPSHRESNSFTPSESQTFVDVDELPLVAIFVEQVSSISKEAGEQPRFRVSGYLLAYCQDRKTATWTSLRSNSGKFWECFMVVQGAEGVSIRASIVEGRLYAVGCSDFRDCDNIPAQCSSRVKQSKSNYPTVALFSTPMFNGLWVEELRFTSDRSKENDVDSNVPIELREASRHFADSFRSWSSHSAWSIVSPNWEAEAKVTEFSRFRDPSLVVLSGTVVYVGVLQTDELYHQLRDPWTSADFMLVLRENETSIFCLRVLFLHRDQKPRGIFSGCSIQIRNVRRRMSEDGTLLFIACEMTRIKVVENGKVPNARPSLCCHRPILSGRNPLKFFPRALLWDFTAAAQQGAGVGRSAKIIGVVRLNILEVKQIEFFQDLHVYGCKLCECLNGSKSCVGARAVVLVEDGSTVGELECVTFPVVMELLGATEDESKKIRANLPNRERLAMLLGKWKNSKNSKCVLEREVDNVMIHLFRLVRRSVHVLVRNQCSNANVVSKFELRTEEVTVRGHNCGYSRKLWTAEIPHTHQVRLEAVAVHEEEFWESTNRCELGRRISARECNNLIDIA